MRRNTQPGEKPGLRLIPSIFPGPISSRSPETGKRTPAHEALSEATYVNQCERSTACPL
jgi:hypothetical protein